MHYDPVSVLPFYVFISNCFVCSNYLFKNTHILGKKGLNFDHECSFTLSLSLCSNAKMAFGGKNGSLQPAVIKHMP